MTECSRLEACCVRGHDDHSGTRTLDDQASEGEGQRGLEGEVGGGAGEQEGGDQEDLAAQAEQQSIRELVTGPTREERGCGENQLQSQAQTSFKDLKIFML